MPERKKPMPSVQVGLKDMYQMLIESCRYGYTRNNHLMPWGSFQHVRSYLPKLIKKDREWGLHTASQLCDEAISALAGAYPNGYDIDFWGGCNMHEYREFIDWLLGILRENGYKMPYNLDQYQWQLRQDGARLWTLEDLDTGETIFGEDDPKSLKEIEDWVFAPYMESLKEGDGVSYNGYCHRMEDGRLEKLYRNFSRPGQRNCRAVRFREKDPDFDR